MRSSLSDIGRLFGPVVFAQMLLGSMDFRLSGQSSGRGLL